MTWAEWLVVVASGLAAAAAGAVVPTVIGRLRPPENTHEDDSDTLTYAQVAALPGLRPRATAYSAVLAALVAAVLLTLSERSADLVLTVPLVPVAVGLAIVDWHTLLLPRVVVLLATAYALLIVVGAWALDAPGVDTDTLVRGLIGLVVARSLFWLAWLVYPRGMGFGDVRLAAPIGLVLAWQGYAELATGLYAGFLLNAVPGLAIALAKRDRSYLKRSYPFGPAMLVGALVGLALGDPTVGLITRG